MRIGRFFSLGQGRVGQYLSPRVLLVRTPFQRVSKVREPKEYCCFGFNDLKQAQKFSQFLAPTGGSFRLNQPQKLKDYPYEVRLVGHTDLARTLAYWDRRDRNAAAAKSQSNHDRLISSATTHPPLQPPKIAA